MEIVIVRQEHKPWGIDGHLYINRKRICDTVEHPRHHLPSGEYQITNDKCQITNDHGSADRQNCQMPHEEWLIPSPFRHGDGALSSLHGEIIVGQSSIPGLVTRSAATYDRLYERLKKAFQRGTPVRLAIRG